MFDIDGIIDKNWDSKICYSNKILLRVSLNFFQRLKKNACQYLRVHRAIKAKRCASLKKSASNIIPAAKFTKNVARGLLFLVNSFYQRGIPSRNFQVSHSKRSDSIPEDDWLCGVSFCCQLYEDQIRNCRNSTLNISRTFFSF